MSLRLGRGVALAVIASAIVYVIAGHYIGDTPGDYGNLGIAAATPGTFRVTAVPKDSSLADAGIQKGELVRWAHWNFQTRAAFFAPMVGSHIALVTRDGRTVTLVAHPAHKHTLTLSLIALKVFFLLVAGLLALRRWQERAVRSLVYFLFGFGLGLALPNSNPVVSSALSFLLFVYGCALLLVFALAAVADFSAHFSTSSTNLERNLARAAIASAALALITIAALESASIVHDNLLDKFAGLLAVLPFVFAIATLIAGYVSARGMDRSRRLWVLLIIGVGILGPAIDLLVTATSGYNAALDQATILTVAVIPVGLAYVILRHRLIDVGFVLNQAAVYAGVSIVVVGVFAIVEMLLSNYVQSTSHVASMAVQLAVALGLGYSINAIHKRVERFVDRVFFRVRHEAEAALHAFSLDAAYITDAALLFERCVQSVERYARASTAGVWLREPSGTYVMLAGDFPGNRKCRSERPRHARNAGAARRRRSSPLRIRPSGGARRTDG